MARQAYSVRSPRGKQAQRYAPKPIQQVADREKQELGPRNGGSLHAIPVTGRGACMVRDRGSRHGRAAPVFFMHIVSEFEGSI
jgi:hypothetical protein